MEQRIVDRLAAALDSGVWDTEHGLKGAKTPIWPEILGRRTLGASREAPLLHLWRYSDLGSRRDPSSAGCCTCAERDDRVYEPYELSIRELLALWASALRELRERGVVRTFNNPIGDIAEELVALHYGGERGSFSQKTWDVRVGKELLQVKALRRTGSRTRRNLSPIRSDDGYTAVIVVIFTEDLRVEEAIRIPREVVNEMFERQSHVNGRIIRIGSRLLQHLAVETIPLSDASLDA